MAGKLFRWQENDSRLQNKANVQEGESDSLYSRPSMVFLMDGCVLLYLIMGQDAASIWRQGVENQKSKAVPAIPKTADTKVKDSASWALRNHPELRGGLLFNLLLRGKGVTIRKSINLIIGTFCIERGHSLLHDDRISSR